MWSKLALVCLVVAACAPLQRVPWQVDTCVYKFSSVCMGPVCRTTYEPQELKDNLSPVAMKLETGFNEKTRIKQMYPLRNKGGLPITVLVFANAEEEDIPTRKDYVANLLQGTINQYNRIKYKLDIKRVVGIPNPCERFSNSADTSGAFACLWNWTVKHYRHTKTHLLIVAPPNFDGTWHWFFGGSFICQNPKQYSASFITVTSQDTSSLLQAYGYDGMAHELGHAFGAPEQDRITLMNTHLFSILNSGKRPVFNSISKRQITYCQKRVKGN